MEVLQDMSPTRRSPIHQRVPEIPLPARNGYERERIAGIQRSRMLTAMVEVTVERGIANVTVAHVISRARVSRRTFYEIFGDREECLVAAFDEALARFAAEIVPVYEAGASWCERMRNALTALLQCLDAEPLTGRFLVVETLGAGLRVQPRRARVLAQAVVAVDEGRGEARHGDDLPALTAEGVVGAVVSVIHSRLPEHGPKPLIELVNPLMSIVVLPYLGLAAARRELERPAPDSVVRMSASAGDPLRDAKMRLTYRTVRVLMSIAVQPGSSNRDIGTRSGVHDQGQISKLLARLQRLGLVENTEMDRGPNAWTLTDRGVEVERSIGRQTNGLSPGYM